jgi:aspartate kinase
VAAGEAVSASLLALALERLGVPALAVDAREAGVAAEGPPGAAHLTAVAPAPLQALLADGITPVVLGFQGWQQARVATLGRGGSDTTAVALAVALGAASCELVKDAGGLFTADPKLAPTARHLPRVPHRFLVQLAAAGAKVVHVAAAELAERHALPLRLGALGASRHTTVGGAAATPLHAVAARSGGCPAHADSVAVTVVSHGAGKLRPLHHRLHRAVRLAGIPLIGLRCGGDQLTFRVADGDGPLLVRLLDHHLARAEAGELPSGRRVGSIGAGELTGSCA